MRDAARRSRQYSTSNARWRRPPPLPIAQQPHWTAQISYNVEDNSYWFSPLDTCPAYQASCAAIVPSRRRDIFVRLGERGSTIMSWPLEAGDGFRVGHTYVVVLRVLQAADSALRGRSGASGLGAEGAPADLEADHIARLSSQSQQGDHADEDEDGRQERRHQSPSSEPDMDDLIVGSATTEDGQVAECCFCYEVRGRALFPPGRR